MLTRRASKASGGGGRSDVPMDRSTMVWPARRAACFALSISRNAEGPGTREDRHPLLQATSPMLAGTAMDEGRMLVGPNSTCRGDADGRGWLRLGRLPVAAHETPLVGVILQRQKRLRMNPRHVTTVPVCHQTAKVKGDGRARPADGCGYALPGGLTRLWSYCQSACGPLMRVKPKPSQGPGCPRCGLPRRKLCKCCLSEIPANQMLPTAFPHADIDISSTNCIY